eukprot:TRINITY_DN39780_c0_g1_i1.p1 TRINITY_DN39780_c0_g1~~TRINITY_DN39780_c0_g1_i1.p1  ORF type:complete len:360 (+),score=57.66 TRINITY_DN39780_c0_g1_i1:28-1107(+)
MIVVRRSHVQLRPRKCGLHLHRVLLNVAHRPRAAFSIATPEGVVQHATSNEAASTWRIGDPPSVAERHPAVVHIGDARDPRVAVYRQKRRQNSGGRGTTTHVDGRADEDVTRNAVLHYGSECLRRLQAARDLGRPVSVHSVLISSVASEAIVELATAASPMVYSVEPTLFRAEFQSKASDDGTQACTFAVTFPVSRPVRDLRPPFLVLDGLSSPRNVGQILRTALHLGVSSIVTSPCTWRAIDGRAARSSMGWLYHLDFHCAGAGEFGLEAALQELKELGVRTYAAENFHAEPVGPHEPPGDRRWALVVGSEDKGLSRTTRSLCDRLVAVPQMAGESLNVGHAASICLYELGRNMARAD